MSYSVIMTCRDGQDTIKQSVDSWLNQTIKPEKIIVINDGSTDNSLEILDTLNIILINQPDTPYDVKRICLNWNKGLRLINSDFHVIATEDSYVESKYAEKILRDFENKRLFCSSGRYDYRLKEPSGIGRFVRNKIFKSILGKYDYRCGFETSILYTGIMKGYETSVNDARIHHTRKLGMNHGFTEFVIGSILLGHSRLYVNGRIIKMYMNGYFDYRKAIELLILCNTFIPEHKGYYSYYNKELREYVRKIEKDKIKGYVKGKSMA